MINPCSWGQLAAYGTFQYCFFLKSLNNTILKSAKHWMAEIIFAAQVVIEKNGVN